MLTVLIRSSLRHPGLVLCLALAVVLLGLRALERADYDVFPDFAPPQAIVQTEATGLSPEQVERLVTRPVEEALHGAPGVESLRSVSIAGLSVVTATLREPSDPARDRPTLAERLGTVAGRLPAGVAAPALLPLTSTTNTVLAAGLDSDGLSVTELRAVADYELRPLLLAVPGVAKVVTFGGAPRRLELQLDPACLVHYGLGVSDVRDAVARLVGQRGVGGFDTPAGQRVEVGAEVPPLTAARLAGCAIEPRPIDPGTFEVPMRGTVVTALTNAGGAERAWHVALGDLGRVVDNSEPPVGAAAIGGHTGVVFLVAAAPGGNTLRVSRQVERVLRDAAPALAGRGVRVHPDLFRPADFIETALGNVRAALGLGALLVVGVLIAFLNDWRAAAISAVAIPLSLLAAVALLVRCGVSLNVMTLGGLAIALGEVVDDAVIDVENILRGLRGNVGPDARPVWQVVLAASLEVRGAVVFATGAVALAFVPVLTLGGLAGSLFAPLGLAYLAAVGASLVVALTVTPALCLLIFSRRGAPPGERRWLAALKARYDRLLAVVERRPRKVGAGVALVTLAGLATVPFFRGGFVPELQEGHFIVHLYAPAGTSLDESLRLGRLVTARLAALPAVRSVAQQAGRAEQADDVLGPEQSDLQVRLRPGLSEDETEEAAAAIRRALAGFPGVEFAVNTFLSERVEETVSGGYTAPVVVQATGEDLDALDRAARAVAAVLRVQPGAEDVRLPVLAGTPALTVQPRPEALAALGLGAADVLDTVQAAFRGLSAGQLYEGTRVVGVAVTVDPAALATLPLRTPAGPFVALGDVVDLVSAPGRSAVFHENGLRTQTVTCSVAAGTDVAAFAAAAQRALATRVRLPPGVTVAFTGAARAQAAARRDLLLDSALAALAIILLLTLSPGTESPRHLFLVLVNLPFALVGGAFAVFTGGGAMSLGAAVGFVTLFGLSLRNSLLLLAHYREMVRVQGAAWNPTTARRGAAERLTPILLTAGVTALGLLPLALGIGGAGSEIEAPMALVILGGLLTSTVLNLLVLPALTARFGRWN